MAGDEAVLRILLQDEGSLKAPDGGAAPPSAHVPTQPPPNVPADGGSIPTLTDAELFRRKMLRETDPSLLPHNTPQPEDEYPAFNDYSDAEPARMPTKADRAAKEAMKRDREKLEEYEARLEIDPEFRQREEDKQSKKEEARDKRLDREAESRDRRNEREKKRRDRESDKAIREADKSLNAAIRDVEKEQREDEIRVKQEQREQEKENIRAERARKKAEADGIKALKQKEKDDKAFEAAEEKFERGGKVIEDQKKAAEEFKKQQQEEAEIADRQLAEAVALHDDHIKALQAAADKKAAEERKAANDALALSEQQLADVMRQDKEGHDAERVAAKKRIDEDKKAADEALALSEQQLADVMTQHEEYNKALQAEADKKAESDRKRREEEVKAAAEDMALSERQLEEAVKQHEVLVKEIEEAAKKKAGADKKRAEEEARLAREDMELSERQLADVMEQDIAYNKQQVYEDYKKRKASKRDTAEDVTAAQEKQRRENERLKEQSESALGKAVVQEERDSEQKRKKYIASLPRAKRAPTRKTPGRGGDMGIGKIGDLTSKAMTSPLSALGDAASTAASSLGAAVPVVAGFTAAVGIAKTVLAELDAAVERYGEYSPEVQQAQAMAEVQREMNSMRRAQEHGEELARYVQMKSDMQEKFEEIKIKILMRIMPIVEAIGKALEAIMPSGNGIEMAITALMGPLMAIPGAVNLIAQQQQDALRPPPQDPTDIILSRGLAMDVPPISLPFSGLPDIPGTSL